MNIHSLKFGFVLIALLAISMNAFAQGGTAGPLTWNINDGTLTISGIGEMPDYQYGPTVDDCAPWYKYQESINTVVIETGVTSIGNFAFSGCHSLTSAIISNSVTSIRYRSFFVCGLASIIIPNSVINIGEYAFSNGNLTSVTIGNSVTTIGEGAFSGSSLPSITIPNSVTAIGSGAFVSCENLTSINVGNGNNSYSSENGVLFSKNKIALICYPAGKTGGYVVPNSVTIIVECAFGWCKKLTSITIPNSITTIGDWALEGCTSIASITIPNSVNSIGYATFRDCTSLTSVMIGNSVTTIGENAFANCISLTTITNLNPVPIAIDPNVFQEMDQSTCTLKVPFESTSAYKNAPVWRYFNIVGTEVGIETIETNAVKIYPNPTSGQLIINNAELSPELSFGDNAEYSIFNLTGQMVLQGKLQGETTTINVASLPSGMYYLRIAGKAGKFVKM